MKQFEHPINEELKVKLLTEQSLPTYTASKINANQELQTMKPAGAFYTVMLMLKLKGPGLGITRKLV